MAAIDLFKKLFFNLFTVLAIYFLIFIFLCLTPVTYILYGAIDEPSYPTNGSDFETTTPSGGALPATDSSQWFTNLFNASLIIWSTVPSVALLALSCWYNGNPLTKPNKARSNPDPISKVSARRPLPDQSTRLEQVSSSYHSIE